MPTETTEPALEACIERFLTGDVSTPTSNDGKAQNNISNPALKRIDSDYFEES